MRATGSTPPAPAASWSVTPTTPTGHRTAPPQSPTKPGTWSGSCPTPSGRRTHCSAPTTVSSSSRASCDPCELRSRHDDHGDPRLRPARHDGGGIPVGHLDPGPRAPAGRAGHVLGDVVGALLLQVITRPSPSLPHRGAVGRGRPRG